MLFNKFNKMKKMISMKKKKKSLVSFLISSGIARRVTGKMVKEISLSVIISAATFLTSFLPGGFFLKFIVGNCIRYTADVLFNPVQMIQNTLKYVSSYIPYKEMRDIDFIKGKLEQIKTMYFEMSNFELIPFAICNNSPTDLTKSLENEASSDKSTDESTGDDKQTNTMISEIVMISDKQQQQENEAIISSKLPISETENHKTLHETETREQTDDSPVLSVTPTIFASKTNNKIPLVAKKQFQKSSQKISGYL